MCIGFLVALLTYIFYTHSEFLLFLGRDSLIFIDGFFRSKSGLLPSLDYTSQLGVALFIIPDVISDLFHVKEVWKLLPLFISINIMFIIFFLGSMDFLTLLRTKWYVILILALFSIGSVIAPIRVGDAFGAELTWHRIYNNSFVGLFLVSIYFSSSLICKPNRSKLDFCNFLIMSILLASVSVYLFLLKFTYGLALLGIWFPIIFTSRQNQKLFFLTSFLFLAALFFIDYFTGYVTAYLKDILDAAGHSSKGILHRASIEIYHYIKVLPVLIPFILCAHLIADRDEFHKDSTTYYFYWILFINFMVDVFDNGPVKIIALSGFVIVLFAHNNIKWERHKFSWIKKSILLVLAIFGLFFILSRLYAIYTYNVNAKIAKSESLLVSPWGFVDNKEYHYFKSGLESIGKVVREENFCLKNVDYKIFVMDLADGFSSILNLSQNKSKILWVHYGVSISEKRKPEFNDLFGDSNIILKPLTPLLPESTSRLFNDSDFKSILMDFPVYVFDDWEIYIKCDLKDSSG